MKRVSIETEKFVIDKYNSGLSCKAISNLLSISETTVFNILKRNNIEMRTKGGIYQLPKEEIIELYKRGFSSTYLSEKYKVTNNTILKILHEAGIEVTCARYFNVLLDEEYFDVINTNEKAYFLGLMISDGSVVGNLVSITSHILDSYILNLFSSQIMNCNPLYYSPYRTEVSVNFKSEKVVNSLSKYGVVQNKTYNTYLPYIGEQYMSHLIRGILDGDGWISSKAHQLGFCGSEVLMTQIRDFLVSRLNVYNVKVLHTEINLWQITWASKKDIITIGNYLYQDAKEFYLTRKSYELMLISR